MRQVYFIEIDLEEEQDITDILKEYDKKAVVRQTRFKSFDEYDDYHYYLDALGVH